MALIDQITRDDGRPLEDAKDISELRMCLLIMAFHGRPLRVVKNWRDIFNAAMQPHLLIVASDKPDSTHHCEIIWSEAMGTLLESNLTDFERQIVNPVLANLDGRDYPERNENYIKAAKRSAELIADAA